MNYSKQKGVYVFTEQELKQLIQFVFWESRTENEETNKPFQPQKEKMKYSRPKELFDILFGESFEIRNLFTQHSIDYFFTSDDLKKFTLKHISCCAKFVNKNTIEMVEVLNYLDNEIK